MAAFRFLHFRLLRLHEKRRRLLLIGLHKREKAFCYGESVVKTKSEKLMRRKEFIETQATELLDDPAVAAVLGVQPRTVRKLRLQDGLPFIRLSAKLVRTRRADLNTWIGRHAVAVRTLPR
jgi:hypothetical protein